MKKTSFRDNSYIYYACLALTIAIFSSIAYTRYYLAAHGWDQILFGFSLGLWLAFFFTFVLRDFITSHVEMILKKDVRDQSVFKAHGADLARITLILGLAYVSVIIPYYLVDIYYVIP